jgi:hypothetical protein
MITDIRRIEPVEVLDQFWAPDTAEIGAPDYFGLTASLPRACRRWAQ